MACLECLSRGYLLERLAAWIEQVTVAAPGRRSRDLLSLDHEPLAAAIGHPHPGRLAAAARGSGAAAISRALESSGAWAICRHQPEWPVALFDLGDGVPHALYGAGSPELVRELSERPAVAVVGARRATRYGLDVARTLGREFAEAGLTVVSGMAYGVDAAAHSGALGGGGTTVAVLGSGADVPYPQGERALYGRIAANGLVLSEMPPGFKPFRWSFPARNRIIAALAAMTVVVQARERSGSLITAQMAGEDLGRELGAVPGPVNSSLSAGTNALLADGAAVVRGASDVLDRLLGIGVVGEADLRQRRRPSGQDPPEELRDVLAAVDRGAATADEVASATTLPAGDVAEALTRLELLGRVGVDSLGRYSRAS